MQHAKVREGGLPPRPHLHPLVYIVAPSACSARSAVMPCLHPPGLHSSLHLHTHPFHTQALFHPLVYSPAPSPPLGLHSNPVSTTCLVYTAALVHPWFTFMPPRLHPLVYTGNLALLPNPQSTLMLCLSPPRPVYTPAISLTPGLHWSPIFTPWSTPEPTFHPLVNIHVPSPPHGLHSKPHLYPFYTGTLCPLPGLHFSPYLHPLDYTGAPSSPFGLHLSPVLCPGQHSCLISTHPPGSTLEPWPHPLGYTQTLAPPPGLHC